MEDRTSRGWARSHDQGGEFGVARKMRRVSERIAVALVCIGALPMAFARVAAASPTKEPARRGGRTTGPKQCARPRWRLDKPGDDSPTAGSEGRTRH